MSFMPGRTRIVALTAVCALVAAAIGIGVWRIARGPILRHGNPPVQRGNKTISGRVFRMEGRRMTRWGDYGDILQHGMTAHLDRTGGRLSLERTGPYMPPITFPGIGDVVLTSEGRAMLEASGLSGFSFQPVYKARIVSLAWQDWNLSTDHPPEYPKSGEPEDYILERPADAGVARKMGEIWEFVIPVTASIGRPERMVESFQELYVERNSWNGAEVFRGDGYGGVLVTERAKAWFEEHLGVYTRFDEFQVK
jgi:hypothetical protein